MIRYITGDLFEGDAEAFVNAVNTVGIMGKGIALKFKESFPENFKAYAVACARGEVEVGRMFVTDRGDVQGPRRIINFPTKRHWRDPSRLEWIVEGLGDLRRVIVENSIRSIAIPALGAGNGGRPWIAVRARMEEALGNLEGSRCWFSSRRLKSRRCPVEQGGRSDIAVVLERGECGYEDRAHTGMSRGLAR
jgi:O-acetyl-ADP-ribose deacetylase (regulator of RNase III)